LHENGGKEHEAPCIPKLETYLDEYIAAAGIAGDKDGPLFRTTERSTGTPHRMTHQGAYRLIQRHAKHAGIRTRIGNHSMRATGITNYLTGRWRKPARWRTTPTPAPHSFTTSAGIPHRWMNMGK
jgi:site-specific recombinase XerD